MSDTAQRWSIRSYHETPEHAAKRFAERGVAKPPESERTVARQALAMTIREAGYVMDMSSITEEERAPVVVDESPAGYRVAGDGETPSGHVVTWSATASRRRGTDADDPVLTLIDGVATVPEPEATAGGSVRIRHNLGGEVTVLARKADGSGIGYSFATTLDKDSVHVEFFGGTATFLVTKD